MASSSISFCHMNNLQQRKPFSIERRPKLLKDFLNDTNNSCSSSGFNSFPRHSKISNPNPKFAIKLPSRKHRPKTSSSSSSSSSSTSTTISAIQAVINAVKNIPFTTRKSPSFLPRSLSRKLSTKRDHSRSKRQEREQEEKENHQVQISVKVKDILRWTSFRDLVEEITPPLDFTTSPHHYTTTTTTTRSIDSSFNSSNGSSWCESDFTAELLPCWSGNSDENEVKMGKKDLSCVGVDPVDATTQTENVGPQDREMLLYEEEDDEQQSPVSVFDFELRENEEHFSTFDQSLANVERARQTLIQNINQFESLANLEPFNSEEHNNDEDGEKEEYELVEEMAKELLVYVKETSSSHRCKSEEDQVLLDFFRDEMKVKQSHDEYNSEMVSLAKSWLNREQKGVLGWGLDYNKEVYIREMHKEGKWSQFEVEQEELALEIEAGMFEQLIDEVLVDHL